MDWLPPVDVLEQMLLPLDEEIVGKLPLFRIDLSESVGIELADEAGEVIVLEVGGASH